MVRMDGFIMVIIMIRRISIIIGFSMIIISSTTIIITITIIIIMSNTPGLHNKISAYNIFARGWVAQKSICS